MNISALPGMNDIQPGLVGGLSQILEVNVQHQLVVRQAAQLQLIHAAAATAATQLGAVTVTQSRPDNQLRLTHLIRTAVALKRSVKGALGLRLIEDGIAVDRGQAAAAAVIVNRGLVLDEGVGEGEADRRLEVGLPRVGEVAE